MIRERLSASPDFRPETSGQLLQLAQLAKDAGDRAMARSLVADFGQRYPNDPLASSVVNLQAELAR
jgi:Tfp pilus assembly protein PilF